MTRGWFTVRATAAGIELLDQRRLPHEEHYVVLGSVEEVARAIEEMTVRGAPAIGCTAALGVALAARTAGASDLAGLARSVEAACQRLARTRPTAVNLFRALGWMREAFEQAAAEPGASVSSVGRRLAERADRILAEDEAACRALGAAGLELVPQKARILTHCNAGALATAGYGTALGVVRAAFEAGREPSVWAGETRPYLQGSRLTAWELQRDGIPVTVITDAMAAYFLGRSEVDLVVVGADRIAANGDVANKIGTYGLALLARAHGVPFYVAAPLSTLDPETPDGAAIPIEERPPEEVSQIGGKSVVPDSVPVRHPAFDVTPAELVTAIVTERGILRPPYARSLLAAVSDSTPDGDAVR